MMNTHKKAILICFVTTLISMFGLASTAYAKMTLKEFGALPAMEKASVRTNEMAEVLQLNSSEKEQILQFNKTKFGEFKVIAKKGVTQKEKRKLSKEVNAVYLKQVRKLVGNAKMKTWINYFKETYLN